jgi:ferredoxin
MRCTATVDDMACSGHGDCALAAPAVFEVDDVATVIGDGPRELLLQAAESCPAAAICVFDADTGEQIYP